MNNKNNSSLQWYSDDIQKESSYLRSLHKNEIQFIHEIFSQLETKNISYDIHRIFQPLYIEIMHALIHARGFIVISGFPSYQDPYHSDLVKKFLLLFCEELGTPLIQNRQQDVIFDVKSIEGMSLGTINSRGPYVKDALPMHTDAGAILGMYCFAASDVGGNTLLASSRTVHDEIQKIRPDLLDIFYEPFYVDRRNNEPCGQLPYDISPIFAMHGNVFRCQYHQPFYLDAQKKFLDIPRLTQKQLEALNLFDRISLEKHIAFEIKIPPGSIIFINNEQILHGRTSFDFPENTSTRHLFRIWLNTPEISHTFPNFLGYQ